MNELIIKQSGFVTGDALLNPVAYAGEMNSRVINVIHPTFENCYYLSGSGFAPGYGYGSFPLRMRRKGRGSRSTYN